MERRCLERGSGPVEDGCRGPRDGRWCRHPPGYEREAWLSPALDARRRKGRTDARVTVGWRGGHGRRAGCERRGVLEMGVVLGERASFAEGLTPSERC